MATLTHAEKDEIIRELKQKLKEMKSVEQQVNATALELPEPAFGLHKDQTGTYSIVEIKYDPESKAAAVTNLISLDSKDPSIASFKLKEYAIERVFRPTVGGKYV
jgi:hypothetical protein